LISFVVTGSFKRTEQFLRKVSRLDILGVMNQYGRVGVAALSGATPTETGRAASSWGYEVSRKGGLYTITWTNSDIENGFPVVIMLQYGHGTGTGGFVQGQDFINPAIRPVFDNIADKVWKAVTSA
jgi:hypothetical protein